MQRQDMTTRPDLSPWLAAVYEKLGWQAMEHCKYRGVTVNVMCKKIAS